ncbi:MAG TPA: hypothetical protein VGG72_29655 [Bryobacteraceae bacterium]|jgi:hypothetical protein
MRAAIYTRYGLPDVVQIEHQRALAAEEHQNTGIEFSGTVESVGKA